MYLNLLTKKAKDGGIFCDLGKAFDCVNRKCCRLNYISMELEKHKKIGFTSYLTNRSQKVEVKSPNTTKHFFF